MAAIPHWDNVDAAMSAMYALDFRDGHLVFAKRDGTPSDDDWAVFMPFIRRYAPRARGIFSFLAGGRITPPQRVEVMEYLSKLERCRFCAITGDQLSKGSVTAMGWAGANSGYEGRSFPPVELEAALLFVDAAGKQRELKQLMRRLIAVIQADPKQVMMPLLR